MTPLLMTSSIETRLKTMPFVWKISLLDYKIL